MSKKHYLEGMKFSHKSYIRKEENQKVKKPKSETYSIK